MKTRILTAVVLALGLTTAGCETGASGDNDDKSEKSDKKKKKKDGKKKGDKKKSDKSKVAIKKGDAVVAQWSGTSFYEGKVEKIGKTIAVKWQDEDNTADVEPEMVMLRPSADAKPDVAVGDLVLAKWSTGTKWYGAKVTSVGDEIGVLYASDGSTGKLAPSKILPAPKKIRADLEKALSHTLIVKEALAAGAPHKPTGWSPKVGEEVVAVWAGDTWYQGSVTATDGPTVKWKDGSTPSKPSGGKVVPVPSDASPKAKAGDYVLLSPESGGATWQFGKVTSVSGDDVKADVQDGSSRTLATKQYIVIQ